MSLHLTHTGYTILILVLVVIMLSFARKMGKIAFILTLILAGYLLLR